MQIAIDFYEKGVSLDDIANGILQKTSAFNLNQIYATMLQSIKAAEKEQLEAATVLDKEYVEKLFHEMKEIVVGINHNAERYAHPHNCRR